MRDPQAQLDELREQGLLRQLRPLDSGSGAQVIRKGRTLWNFASNDYLGLARHPRIEAALIEGVQRYGAGSAAARLVCGTLPPHVQLEERIAETKQSEAALTFSSGFATALGVIPAVVGKHDHVILDKLCHASLVDGARLSGATLRVFPHNDVAKLDRLLQGIRAKHADSRILVLTESVFSMDGDLCPLRELVEITERHDALLLLDEAHGFGVLGDQGMGLAEREGLQQRITFQMGTLSKAAGLSGGYLAASRVWIDLLLNRSRSFIYSTAPPPAIAHAALSALDLIRGQEGRQRRETLARHIAIFGQSPTAIQPLILGSNQAALDAAASFEDAGFLVPAIRYPTVPRNTARLRFSLSAAHDRDTIEQAAEKMKSVLR
ncbi:MAG TPA: 8-amino-7-oxononanoate synthase [Luteolibacter sp.]|nr:8-amino-7-oxononanoate synthase [Luteolibacter sp.]